MFKLIIRHCSTNTGTRNRIRTFRIIYQARNNGIAWPSDLLESDNCNVDCSGNWNVWNDCSANTGMQSRTYRIINKHKNNGLVCPSNLLEFQKCETINIFNVIINFFKLIFIYIYSLLKN